MDQAGLREHVERLYELALGRRPEPGVDISGFLTTTPERLNGVFFTSPEFHQRVAGAYALGGVPLGEAFDYPPTEPLKSWAVGAFGLTDNGAERVMGAGSWAALYLALFDEDGHHRLGLGERPFGEAAWAALRALVEAEGRRPVAGALDFISPERVGGWAVDLTDPGRIMNVELWVEGRFVSAGVTGGFRRDIEERFPGATAAGYSLPLPPHLLRPGADLRLEVRETGHAAAIGEGRLNDPAPAERLAYAAVRQELAAVRDVLTRLEARLPAIEHRLTLSLADWPAYFDAWYRPAHQAIRAIPIAARPVSEVRVRIDAAGGTADWVEAAIDSAMDQSRRPAGVHVVGLDAQGERLLADLIARRRWTGRDATPLAAGEPSKVPAPILSFTADGVLAPDAVAWVEQTFGMSPDLAAAYVDEDRLDGDEGTDWISRPHGEPSLKPGFDLDLLRQSPWPGDCLAFRGDQAPASGAWGGAALLALAENGGRIDSIPRVLFSRRAEAPSRQDSDVWAGVVRAQLKRMKVKAEVEPQTDALGATVPGAVRLRHPVPKGATATVIIPTRDRADLLRPCLDSIEGHRVANRCAMRVVVIDHASTNPETLALLADRSACGQVEVLPYDGEFNWALMNNRAADVSADDVLVFLNNDTIVISPEWLDALVGQALRPGVGAVGARLVYQDGALQHAGMVARPRDNAFLIHEGMGVPGSDAGHLGRHALAHEAVAVTGACLATAASVFRRLGGFDAAALPVEGNDVDYCLRARTDGLRVIYEPAATLYHLESRSRGVSQEGERLRASMEATRTIWRRWGERFGDDPRFNPHFARDGRPFDRLRPPPTLG